MATKPTTAEAAVDAVKAAQARARAKLQVTAIQAQLVKLAAQAAARNAAKAKAESLTAPVGDKLLALPSSPTIGQALGVLTMSGVTSLIKNMAIKIGGEWIDTTTMSTTLMSAVDVANKEGQPSVFSECELRLKLEYDFGVVPPVMASPASCSLAFGPSAAQTLAGDSTIREMSIDGALDVAVTLYDAEIKFSGLVTLG